MLAQVTFYFDVQCPYAYLGATQIERVAAGAGAALVWRPMLLGGVFNAIGRTGSDLSPAKAKAGFEDLQRWARRWKLPPVTYPVGHPRRTVEAMRLCVAAEASGKVAPVAHALYRAYWVDARDVAADDRAVLTEVAAANGVDLALIESDAVKDRLRAYTDEAVALGVFGAPSFLVENQHGKFLFWGQDRLDFVEKALGGWKVPA